MATIKSYTDIEQSRKLSKILHLDSADYCWGIDNETMCFNNSPYPCPWKDYTCKEYYIPCWSLAALLEVLPKEQHPELMINAHYKWVCDISNPFSFAYEPTAGDNPLDVVFEMIVKLHELKML